MAQAWKVYYGAHVLEVTESVAKSLEEDVASLTNEDSDPLIATYPEGPGSRRMTILLSRNIPTVIVGPGEDYDPLDSFH